MKGIMMVVCLMIGMCVEGKGLIEKLIQVESSGNNSAIGDGGKAKGCLQIWDCVLKDVNRIYKKKYSRQDCFDREKSVEICRLYLMHYGKAYEKKTGQRANEEVLARIWNGGPNGWKKESTVKYWVKVKRVE